MNEHTYPIEHLPADLLTHLFSAFATIEDGRPALPSAAPAQLAAIKRAYRTRAS